MKDWDRNLWQGRSRKQVETNGLIAAIVIGSSFGLLMGLLLGILFGL